LSGGFPFLFSEKTMTSRRLFLLAAGPDVPSGRIEFRPAATAVDGRTAVNTSEAVACRLSESGDAWEKVSANATVRIVHRLIPLGKDVLLVGGAVPGGGKVAELDRVKLADAGVKVEAKAQKGSDR